MYFARIQFLSYFFKQTSGEIPVVFDFKFLIYDKKKNIGHEHLFFSNHLKSTKIKQSSFGKHQKLNIHILTENCQNIPTPKYPNLRYGVQCQVIYYICIYISSEYLSFSGLLLFHSLALSLLISQNNYK